VVLVLVTDGRLSAVAATVTSSDWVGTTAVCGAAWYKKIPAQ